ncbi:serine hydrolase domain-containing protein [Pontibacter cellulosilyticus]|uniref:Beta-lactamase family protein n=1 Tax=Pontibacter cellulosilyticus TaxID=1720253 RepID=A0A923SN23_9BACT|nr:serine hydrolase domain-containing protein [Pontibacter cellulosilyticus]MBC5992755.1 beta-lactamase family protein [Pontibacter cellulosilyticus]
MLKHTAFILSLALLLCNFALGQSKYIYRVDGSKTTASHIDKTITRLMDTANVTGLGISIFNNNEVVYQKAFGYSNAVNKTPLSANTIFYGASLSKAVFAVLVMQLVEEGVIEWDTPLQSYLEKPLSEYGYTKKNTKSWNGYLDLKGDKRYEKITARMCLTHTTGFPNWRFLTSTGYKKDGKLYFQFEPGARYSYSGEGFALLQFVIEQITGKGLEELAQERIFKPLGMCRTSYIYVWQPGQEKQYVYGHDSKENVIPKDEVDDAGAAGSMGTTLADYSKFLEAVLNQQLLKQESYKELFKKQVAISSKQQFGPNSLVETTENEDIALGYGLGWGVLETPYGKGVFKEGGSEGYKHYSILFPETGTGVLIMTNSDNAESIFKELLEITIGDTYTPWQWENYVPYEHKTQQKQ